MHRRCYEVMCNPISFTDGYGNTVDRTMACKAPGTSVVVTITDTCAPAATLLDAIKFESVACHPMPLENTARTRDDAVFCNLLPLLSLRRPLQLPQ